MSNSMADIFPGLDARVVLQDILGIKDIIDSGEELHTQWQRA